MFITTYLRIMVNFNIHINPNRASRAICLIYVDHRTALNKLLRFFDTVQVVWLYIIHTSYLPWSVIRLFEEVIPDFDQVLILGDGFSDGHQLIPRQVVTSTVKQ